MGFLVPEMINAKHTPGSMEWAIASLTNACFLRKAKQPTIAAAAPSSIVPNATNLTLGSEKDRKSSKSFIYFLFFSRIGKSCSFTSSPTLLNTFNLPP